MKYIRLFENDSDYSQYVGGGGTDYVEPHVVAIKNSINVYYKGLPMTEKVSEYLTMEALEDGFTVSYTESENTIQYSIDNCQTWNELPPDTETPAINTGDKISFKCNVSDLEYFEPGMFSTHSDFNLKGNVMSMLFGDEGNNNFDLTGYDYAFTRLFWHCRNLQSVSKDFLPATTLSEGCYFSMFEGCTSLVTAPELPATTLAEDCYTHMFSDCESLTQSPELPATTLAKNCYGGMFANTNILPDCSNIDFTSESVVASGGLKELFMDTVVTDEDLYNILPINPSTGKYWLPVTTLANNCYENMFYGCSSLVTAPELPATTLAISCYTGMFRNCKSLVNAPILSATILVTGCYNTMFYNSPNLKYIKALFTTTPGPSYTSVWVGSVSSTGTFVKNADATWNVTGNNGIPTGWTVETV